MIVASTFVEQVSPSKQWIAEKVETLTNKGITRFNNKHKKDGYHLEIGDDIGFSPNIREGGIWFVSDDGKREMLESIVRSLEYYEDYYYDEGKLPTIKEWVEETEDSIAEEFGIR